MRLEIDALCHKGLVRAGNEDALSVCGLVLRDDTAAFSLDTPEEGFFYLLVADGMGGHDHGEEASVYALEKLRGAFADHRMDAENFEDDIREVVAGIAAALNSMAAQQGQQFPMGCTLTGVVWYYGRVWQLNAGDSRTYRCRGGVLRQLTTDETERGITGNPEADKRLLNCVGGGLEGHLSVDDISGKLLEGDTLLVCSDGLSDLVSDEQIETAVSEGATAADLYRMACEAGGVDNVSVILARVVSQNN